MLRKHNFRIVNHNQWFLQIQTCILPTALFQNMNQRSTYKLQNSYIEMFWFRYLFFNFRNQNWIPINTWNACVVYLQIF
jgi:hypothetical protein